MRWHMMQNANSEDQIKAIILIGQFDSIIDIVVNSRIIHSSRIDALFRDINPRQRPYFGKQQMMKITDTTPYIKTTYLLLGEQALVQ